MRRFLKHRSGVTAIDYGMMPPLIVGLIFVVVTRLGDNTRVLYCEMAQDVSVAGGAPDLHFSPNLFAQGCTPAVQPIVFPVSLVRDSGFFGSYGIIDGNFGDIEDPIGAVFDVPGSPGYSPAGTQTFAQYGSDTTGSPWAAVAANSAEANLLQSACANGTLAFPSNTNSYPGPALGVAQTTTIATTGAAELQSLGTNPLEYLGLNSGALAPHFSPDQPVVTCYAPK